MNKKHIIGIFIIIILGICLYLLVRVQQNKDIDSVKIGAIFSITGNGASYGEPARNALMLAVEDINNSGGIDGRPLEVIYEDSQFDTKTALSAYQSLKARGVEYFFTNGSAIAKTIAGTVVKDATFQFEVGAVTPTYRDGKSNTCRATVTADRAGEKIGDFIAEQLHAKRVALITLNDEYGNAMRDEIVATLQDNGVVVALAESISKEERDYRTHITKIKSLPESVDAIVAIPIAAHAESLFKQMKELGVTSIPLVSDNWTIINQNLKDMNVIDGVYFSDYDWETNPAEKDSRETKKFKETFVARFGYSPPPIAGTTYDSMMVLKRALEKNGGKDPKTVGDWISSYQKSFLGITGSITFDSDCEGERDVVIRQVRNSEFTQIK